MPAVPGNRGRRKWIAGAAAVVLAASAVAASLALQSDGPPATPPTTGAVAGCAPAKGSIAAVTLAAPCPAEVARVRYCEPVSGTSALPAGKTLVLGVQNFSGNRTYYWHAVTNWDRPDQLANWTGTAYFGNQSVGQNQEYKLSVVVIDPKQLHDRPDSGDTVLPGGEISVSITVKRGQDDSFIPGC